MNEDVAVSIDLGLSEINKAILFYCSCKETKLLSRIREVLLLPYRLFQFICFAEVEIIRFTKKDYNKKLLKGK